MTDDTPKPKRKRRRWIIAGVLLFVVAVASWWYWPRADERFVGKWIYEKFTPPGEPEPPDLFREYRADGTMRVINGALPVGGPTRWRVHEGELSEWRYHPNPFMEISNHVHDLMKSPQRSMTAYKVVSITPDQMILQNPSGSVARLFRVRE
jgi:hypothetical protein